MRLVSKVSDPLDGSAKFVLETSGGHRIESVYLPDPRFFGFCISTQVGCNMGCTFCATAAQRSRHNLTDNEMVEQVDTVLSATESDLPFDFVTLAGMGEPLANFRNSTRALERLRERHPTLTVASLSTVGLTPAIRRLTQEGRDFRLYLSLHAATDIKRRQLIPMADHYPIFDLVDAVSAYGELNGAEACRVSYLLLKGRNDTPDDLERLNALLSGRPVMLQILLWNNVPGMPFERVSDEVADQWAEALNAAGIHAYLMRSMGRSIDAACGQLVTRLEDSKLEGVG
jgi:23S rRNA (adenine2503-C2)-methyltransferase